MVLAKGFEINYKTSPETNNTLIDSSGAARLESDFPAGRLATAPRSNNPGRDMLSALRAHDAPEVALSWTRQRGG